MCGIEGVSDLNGEIDDVIAPKRSILKMVAQRAALEPFEDEKAAPVVLADFVNRADVGMIQRRRHPRFARETFDGLRIARVFLRQKLQRDLAAEIQIFGEIDDSHAATAEFFKNAVVRDCLAQHL